MVFEIETVFFVIDEIMWKSICLCISLYHCKWQYDSLCSGQSVLTVNLQRCIYSFMYSVSKVSICFGCLVIHSLFAHVVQLSRLLII